MNQPLLSEKNWDELSGNIQRQKTARLQYNSGNFKRVSVDLKLKYCERLQ